MKTNLLLLVINVLLITVFAGCDFIEGVFKTGIWVGVIIVIAVLAILGFIFSMFKK